MQVPNGKYKPPTAIGDAERHCRAPFNAHAAHLGKRYGAVTAINLVNQHGSEGRLSAAFDALVQGLPTNMPFQLATFDFHKECGKASYECASRHARVAIDPYCRCVLLCRSGGEKQGPARRVQEPEQALGHGGAHV